MSGLLVLLDDVAVIAKLAAAQLDDVAAQAADAGTKAAGLVIDDAAVTPKYVTGLPAAREVPIVWQIARGSLVNKLVILLPAALLLSRFAPWALTPLLMLGGCYLCFEGAEKVLRSLGGHVQKVVQARPPLDAVKLEKQRVKKAIKTDFILSAEIMAISLGTLAPGTAWYNKAIVLALIAIVMTFAVYGVVGLIVKADDLGVLLARYGRLAFTRSVGRRIVKTVPGVLRILTIVGTAAMLWVGGDILVHGLHDLGVHMPEAVIKQAAQLAAETAPEPVGVIKWGGLIKWTIIALLNGLLGLAVGFTIAQGLGIFKQP